MSPDTGNLQANSRKGRPDFFQLKHRRSRFLDIPQPVRLKIWKFLGFSYTRTLRLVCSTIKQDIDEVIGISADIDSTFDDFSFLCTVAIRKASIHELITPAYVEFLKFPLALEELEIRGEISRKNFNYILKSCPNITTLRIIFNKFVLDCNTTMFPLLAGEPMKIIPLAKLQSIKLIASTRRASEIQYVYKNVKSLLMDNILQNITLRSLHILIAHRSTSPFVKELMATTLMFLHKHLSTLYYLDLTFKDKDPTASTMASEDLSSSGSNPEVKQPPTTEETTTKPSENSKSNKRKSVESKSLPKSEKQTPASNKNHPAPPPAPLPLAPPAPPSLQPPTASTRRSKELHGYDPSAMADKAKEQDDLSPNTLPPEDEGEANVETVSKVENASKEEANDVISVALRFIQKNPWPPAKQLNELILAVPLRVMEGLTTMINSETKLSVINLEGYGGNHQNWPIYVDFAKRGNLDYLEHATFHHVYYTSPTGKSLPINLGVFKTCKNLKRLTVLGDMREDFTTLPRASHISSLPTSLENVTFERLLLTSWQAFRLIYCHTEMKSVTLEYWSISNRQFATFMKLLKWAVKCDCTAVKKINLVETKIKFNHERKAVRNLQEAVAVSAAYQDDIVTRLVVDTTQRKSDSGMAPILAFTKITPPQPKPERNKKKSAFSK